MGKAKRHEKPRELGMMRRGWTTGACATAATKAALTALLIGEFPDSVSIRLPKGEEPVFPLALRELGAQSASAGIVKDAGDDPDVTHGATIIATLRAASAGEGVTFKAGNGVGTITRPGLPLCVGEPAINPAPRRMMSKVVDEIAAAHGVAPDFEITISVPGGEEIARQTWNPRLGIIGGISILGTTGIVHPFSCSAWIHSIRQGVDVCRASGISHALAATGSTSEDAARRYLVFADEALIDMGDFAGGLLKYLRDHPIARLTLAGGFAKFTKLAQGAMDLHSGRSQVDLDRLSDLASDAGLSDKADAIRNANTALQVLDIAGRDSALPARIAELARQQALAVLGGAPVEIEVLLFDREGELLARAGSFDG